MTSTASLRASVRLRAPGRVSCRAIGRLASGIVLGGVLGTIMPLQPAALAADANAGKARAAQCAACHGPDGIAVLPEAPNIAGQVEGYLVKSLKDYRSGARKQEQMNVMAKGLSDRDIENLAAYYHQLPAGGQGAAR